MTATDRFDTHFASLDSPLASGARVSPSDTEDLPQVSRALHVGGGGDLRVVMAGGEIVTFSGLSSGWHPIRVTRILETGTSASAIVACW